MASPLPVPSSVVQSKHSSRQNRTMELFNIHYTGARDFCKRFHPGEHRTTTPDARTQAQTSRSDLLEPPRASVTSSSVQSPTTPASPGTSTAINTSSSGIPSRTTSETPSAIESLDMPPARQDLRSSSGGTNSQRRRVTWADQVDGASESHTRGRMKTWFRNLLPPYHTNPEAVPSVFRINAQPPIPPSETMFIDRSDAQALLDHSGCLLCCQLWTRAKCVISSWVRKLRRRRVVDKEHDRGFGPVFDEDDLTDLESDDDLDESESPTSSGQESLPPLTEGFEDKSLNAPERDAIGRENIQPTVPAQSTPNIPDPNISLIARAVQIRRAVPIPVAKPNQMLPYYQRRRNMTPITNSIPESTISASHGPDDGSDGGLFPMSIDTSPAQGEDIPVTEGYNPPPPLSIPAGMGGFHQPHATTRHMLASISQ